MHLWALLPRITGLGIQAEWIIIQIRSEKDLAQAVEIVSDQGALIVEFKNGDKFLEGIISPEVISPLVLA